jgi:predicted O-methyltransferase YrrM
MMLGQRGLDHSRLRNDRRSMDIVTLLEEERPAFHGGGTVRWDATHETLQMIEECVQAGDRTLETGCGASTVVFAARGAHHTAISPSEDEQRRVRQCCEHMGVDDGRLTMMVAFSDDVLPVLCAERVFDVVFIDGAHSFPYPEVDWHYATRGLKIGGRLILDDIPIPSIAPLFRHMSLEPNWRLDGILDNRSAAFSLLAPPKPEDWTTQPYNRGYPDYSFVPFPRRAKLTMADRIRRARRSAGDRYPALRDAWRRSHEGNHGLRGGSPT